MARFIIIAMLLVLTVAASFVGRCEQKSTAGTRMIRLIAIFFQATAVTDAGRNKRIAGGRWVHNPSKYPWIVAMGVQYNCEDPHGKSFIDEAKCTGSFIDIYGSILTAGHCLKRTTYLDEEDSYCQLARVIVTWGSTSPLRNLYPGWMALIPESGIRRFKRQGLERLKGDIDVALMFPSNFEKAPMTPYPKIGPSVRPIELATVTEPIEPSIPNGTVVGFGAQPVMFNETAWSYVDNNTLREISMQYGGHFRRVCGVEINPLNRARLVFRAHAIIDQLTDEAARLPPMIRGPCTGDSGGPYMVMEDRQMKLRGLFVRLFCTPEDPCVRLNDTSTFIDVNHKRLRAWLIKELKERYTLMRVNVSAVPMTVMQA